MGGRAPGDSKAGEGNVFALFPGIDTTPFGEQRQFSDDGWSAVPERTIIDETQAASLTPDVGTVRTDRHRPRATRGALAAALAVFVGVGLGFAHSLLTPADQRAADKRPAKQLATISPVQHQTTTGAATGRTLRRSRAKHRAATDHAAPRSRRSRTHHAGKPRTKHHARASASASSSHAVVATTTTTTAAVSEPASSGPTATQLASSSPSSSSGAAAQPSGPTGRVSLIGAGTTPSG